MAALVNFPLREEKLQDSLFIHNIRRYIFRNLLYSVMPGKGEGQQNTKRPGEQAGSKTEILDRQNCLGMPLCSDHSLSAVSLNGAFVQPSPDGCPGNLSPRCTAPHLHKHRDVCTQATFLFWDSYWEQSICKFL